MEKIKDKFSNFKSSIKEKFSDLKTKIKGNKSLFYYVVSFFLVAGLSFFVSSKSLFDKGDKEVRSTTINEIQENNTLQAKLLSRKYNPLNQLVEFIVYAKDEQNFNKQELIFQLREQGSPNTIIETRYQKIADDYYVVFAKVPKKWHVLSLSFGYESELESAYNYTNIEDIDSVEELEEDKNKDLVSIIRIYNDINDIEKNNFLKERSSKEYFDEIFNLEVKYIELEIEKINHKISENVKIKEDADEKITELKNEKKYQTESEQSETDFNISSIKGLVDNKNAQNKAYSDLKDELKIKIDKLNEKKRNYEENGLY